jgi:hypothetical protein
MPGQVLTLSWIRLEKGRVRSDQVWVGQVTSGWVGFG